MQRLVPFSLLILLLFPALTHAADNGHGDALPLPIWSAAPFALLLLCIAVLPLAAGHFWHKNHNKLLISVVLSIPVVLYLVLINDKHAGSLTILRHGIEEYLSFIILLGSLYAISGGIVIEGSLKGKPLTNGAFLLTGAVLANFIGTTGASMLLIRPYLRMNANRERRAHLPIFFIFMVSNLGGLLTPLGDPPLFLGFLRGVDFFWTARLWSQWLVANGGVLLVFLIWDTVTHAREGAAGKQPALTGDDKGLRVRGLFNFLFLGGVMGAVLLKSWLPVPWKDRFVSEGVMLLMSLLSFVFTERALRRANQFTWAPIVEVAALFIGIFVTMVPALEVLKRHGPSFPLSQPWHYFWLTGSLSAFLDNAPTYVTFGQLAVSGLPVNPHGDFIPLMEFKPEILAAISCGAVFMGALTYIGNGPNFMVKAITEESGTPMPSFFGYLGYSCLILLPIFVGITFVYFL